MDDGYVDGRERDRGWECRVIEGELMCSFLSNFAKKPFTVNEQIKLIHDFLDVSLLIIDLRAWKEWTI